MKYQALFNIFEKSNKIKKWRLLKIIGSALRVKPFEKGFRKVHLLKHKGMKYK